ncbi:MULTISPECIES: hypothetical protein [Burkholderia]|uniref:hypothetical protein n=1 Tax=Burkholderia TaxID=32008 RepID=UPI00041329DB|nr:MULTISPECIES: hypothetical protein [Burkholderia]
MFPVIRKLVVAVLGCLSMLAALAADRQPWPGATADKPLVGIQVKIQSFTPDDARQVRQAGFEFVRFGVWTDHLDRAAYRRQIDNAFAAARSARLPVLLTVRALKPLAPAASSGDAFAATLANAGERTADAIVQLADQHARALVAVELWNEPDLGRYWSTGDVVHTFPLFANALCRRLTERRTAVPIVGFAFARAPLPGSVPDRLLMQTHGAAPHCLDAVAYHAYGMTPAQIRDAAHDIGARYGLPAIVTEVGVPSAGAAGEQRQAKRLRALFDARGHLATPLISLYEWADTAHATDAAQRSYGIVRDDRTPKPALDAVESSLRAVPAGR